MFVRGKTFVHLFLRIRFFFSEKRTDSLLLVLFVISSGRARINLYFSYSFAWKKNIIATIYYQEKEK